jgi:hypothetical protein
MGAVMTERQRLPNRRRSENFTFELDGLRFTATIGLYRNGRMGKLFLNNHKAGNQSDTNARDAAIILSFAIQHGADPNEIRKALCRDADGRALGPVCAALDILPGERKPCATRRSTGRSQSTWTTLAPS